jgi:hypothetical protein
MICLPDRFLDRIRILPDRHNVVVVPHQAVPNDAHPESLRPSPQQPDELPIIGRTQKHRFLMISTLPNVRGGAWTFLPSWTSHLPYSGRQPISSL